MRWVVLFTWLGFLILASIALANMVADSLPASQSGPALLVLAWIGVYGAYGSYAGFRAARLTRQLRAMHTATRSF